MILKKVQKKKVNAIQALQDSAGDALNKKAKHLLHRLGQSVTATVSKLLDVPEDDSGGGLVEELKTRVLWALVEDARRLLGKRATPLLAEVANPPNLGP